MFVKSFRYVISNQIKLVEQHQIGLDLQLWNVSYRWAEGTITVHAQFTRLLAKKSRNA